MWHNKNFGKSPFDPDYDDNYDAEKDYDEYLDRIDEKYQNEKER